MANEFMFDNLLEFTNLKGGVLSYLQRDIDKLIKTKKFDAEFVNIASSAKASGLTWLLLKAYCLHFKDNNDIFGTEHYIYFVYPIQQNLFTRDKNYMNIVDKAAGIIGKQDKLSDIDLVKVRILYHLYTIIKVIESDDIPGQFMSKKYLVVDYANAGNLNWRWQDNLPGGFN